MPDRISEYMSDRMRMCTYIITYIYMCVFILPHRMPEYMSQYMSSEMVTCHFVWPVFGKLKQRCGVKMC